MNHFPKFEPNDPAQTQLTSSRLNMVSLGQKSNQVQPGVGYRVTQTAGGTTVSPIKRRRASVTDTILPFQIRVTADSLIAAPGVIGGDSIAETVEASPADGTWYFEADVTINATSGAITAMAAAWVASLSTETSTDFFLTVGSVDVVSGVPDSTTIVQYTYGPLLVLQYGAVADVWKVQIF